MYEGALKNNYLYNDKELFDDADLNWYDYGFRNYDPQIGRFTQLDPLTDDFPFLTPYQYASCDPINNIDLDGLEGVLSTTVETAITLGEVIARNAPKMISTVSSGIKIGTAVGTALKISNTINIAFSTKNVGNVSESTRQGSNDKRLLDKEDLKLPPLDLENDQVMRSCKRCWEVNNEGREDSEYGWGGRDWDGWQVDEEGYLTGKKIIRLSYSNGPGELISGGKSFKMVRRLLKLGKTAKGVTNVIPEGKLANHLFKGAGKLADNSANRALIQKISNGKAIGIDPHGKSWYSGLDAAGKSIYSYTQNGVVKGAGYMSMSVEEMIIKYGLK